MVVQIQVVIEKMVQAPEPIIGTRFSEEEMFAANTITGELTGNFTEEFPICQTIY